MKDIEENIKDGLSLNGGERIKYLNGAVELLKRGLEMTSKIDMPCQYVTLSYLLANIQLEVRKA